MTALLLLFFTIAKSPGGKPAKAELSRRSSIARLRQQAVLAMLSALLLTLFAVSCDRLELTRSTWAIYRNPHYHFEFPYPKSWVQVASPANRDGQAFTAPGNPNIEIRGWASQILLDRNTHPASPQPAAAPGTFATAQGLTGNLRIEIREETTAVTLTLIRDQVTYSWQGRSPNHQFAEYYPLFDYVARQYRIPLQRR
jgi:hypothetical protein